MRIRAAKIKAMQQEVEKREQERQKRERLRWIQIQAAMARVTQSSENPSHLTKCSRRPSTSPAPPRAQSPFLRRSSTTPAINEEAQKVCLETTLWMETRHISIRVSCAGAAAGARPCAQQAQAAQAVRIEETARRARTATAEMGRKKPESTCVGAYTWLLLAIIVALAFTLLGTRVIPAVRSRIS